MSQSKIQDVKVVPHVSAVGYASERQHPELDSETKYYLRNRLIVVTGDLSLWLAATGFRALCRVATDARQQTSRFPGGHTFSGHTESKNPVELPACPHEFDGRSKCEGEVTGQTARHYLIFETVGGFCGIAWNNVGITRFQLPTKSAEAAERTLLRRLPGAERGAPTPEVVEAVAAVKRYFEGEETDFSGFKLDLGGQDPFFEQIYAAARRVGWGRTTTYGTLAKELGAGPEAARDVGQAMAKNPVALIIPCHRVLAAGGKVGGFSAPGGSAAKIRMLALEGIHLEPPAPAQQSFGF